MLNILALLCLLSAPVLLILLSVIDLRVRLLPNIYNAALAAAGILFHLFTQFHFLAPLSMFIGAVIGAGLLYAIRFVANRLYNQDTLGLGDVKLMGAAGLWLGPDMILKALVIGALAGVVHGVGMMIYARFKTKASEKLSTFAVPAGPGFCVGIFVAGAVLYWPFIEGIVR